MMNCRQFTRLSSELLEKQLPLPTRMGLRLHVMICRGCRNFGRQMQFLREVARSYAKRRDCDPGQPQD